MANLIKTVAIIGAGQMGAGIAQVAAVTGHNVVLNDVSDMTLKRAKSTLERTLKQDINVRKMKSADAKDFISQTVGKIKMTTDLAESVNNADLVVEAVDENLSIKQKLFAQIESLSKPDTILATNSAALTIAEISGEMKNRENFGGVQFYNPVHVTKVVKIIKCISTSQATFEKLEKWGEIMGKETVRCIDTPDFIIDQNARQAKKTRLLFPYMMEALRELEAGGKTFEEIDEAMKGDSNLPMGPFSLLDYVGLDTAQFVIEGWNKSYPHEDLYKTSPLVDQMVKNGNLGRKTGEGFYKY